VGFTRIALKPGETRRLAFALDAKALSTVDEAGNRAVEPGPAYIWIGGGQPAGASGTRRSSGVALQTTVKGRRSLPPF
jgi:beta-glucosidase